MSLIFDRLNKYIDKYNYKVKGITSLDKTVFILTCENTTSNIEFALNVFKNILYGKYLLPNYIKIIRKDIIKEYNNVLNSNFIMYEDVLRLSNLSKYMPIGTINSINDINYDDIIRYFNKYYITNDSAIIAISNSNTKLLNNKIRDTFSSLNKLNIDYTNKNFDKNTKKFSKKFYYREIVSNTYEYLIHIFIPNNQNNKDKNSIIRFELLETITITLFEEILKTFKFKSIYDIYTEINQFSFNGRFIHLVLKSSRYIENLKHTIKNIKKQIFLILEKDDTMIIFINIVNNYKKLFESDTIKDEQYLNQVIDVFLYDKIIYNNNDLLIRLNSIRFNDIKKNLLQLFINSNKLIFQISSHKN